VIAGGATTEGFVERVAAVTEMFRSNVNPCRNTSMPQRSATVEYLT
jgi:hypothetical protein